MLTRKVMGLFLVQSFRKYMFKNLSTEGFQQCVLRLKMRVKGRPAHICQVDNLLNRNFRVVFFFQKLRECPEYRLSAFSLSAAIDATPNNFSCFVPYRTNPDI